MLTCSFQMPIPGFVIAFFVMLRSSPMGLCGKVVVFSGLSVQGLDAVT
jgi:hypothetical protein